MRATDIVEPIFQRQIIILAGNRDECNKWLKKTIHSNGKPITKDLIPNTAKGCCMGLTGTDMNSNDKHRWFIIWLDRRNNDETLSHEVNHLTIDLLTDAGLKINKQNTEMFAYYNTYLYREIKKKLGLIPVEIKGKEGKHLLGYILLLVFYLLAIIFAKYWWERLVLAGLYVPFCNIYLRRGK